MKPGKMIRRVLEAQFDVIRRLKPAVCSGDADALHDWRVSARRLRTLMRVLSDGKLVSAKVETLQSNWRLWSKKLGPARDADVWGDVLRRPAFRRGLIRIPEGRAFLEAQMSQRHLFKKPVRKMLDQSAYDQLILQTGVFLKFELQKNLEKHAAEKITRAIQLAFDREIKRARRKARQYLDTGDQQDLHLVRRCVRRARDLAETCHVFCPVVSPKMRHALQESQSALGVAHDAENHLTLLKGLSPAVARYVRASMRSQRDVALARFRKYWRQVKKHG